MAPSVDGRIVTASWKLPSTLYAEYERTARTFDADAWMIGRVSMAPYAGKASIPKRKVAPVPRKDFIARRDAGSYAIALDPSGKLRWRSNDIDGEHVITVLTEKVSDAYLAFLQSKGISYLFGGRSDVNLKRALEKLHQVFGIKKLLLEGGGKINGSFLAADLVDELSLLIAPVADGSIDTPTLFDAGAVPVARRLKLKSVQKRSGDLVWLRYTRAR
ncbi:bifunctional deaminase-reductase domain protein [Chondromyces apiculatus DSM 436]|uniref:Bifunctional deaminase-reductase domain protein n=2 Tax=Chondromyces apiculatus TaxID=51 RepID=A0A017TH15_9BACT|nr:bifunctional deaminase-reductase domain protein [Chondromyces apiculatus DSM 436]